MREIQYKMEVKLDKSILDIINSNYKIDPSVFRDIEQRRQNSEAATSSIKDILQNAPSAPPLPKKTDSDTDQIINNSNYEYTLKVRELESILDLLSLSDVSIDKTSEIIRKIDSKAFVLVNEINDAINAVNAAYQARISIGCRSNLIWSKIGISTAPDAVTGAAVTYSNYRVIKDPTQEVVTNYYGIKYYQKPSNRDYGFNIIAEVEGSILVGSQNLAVVGTGSTLGIQIGDEITDNLNTPIAFNIGSLPKVVGFGVTSLLGITTSISGNVALGSSVIAYTGVGSTGNILIGNYVSNIDVFDSDTRVVGFGTTITRIMYTNVVVPAIQLSKVSISSVTNSTYSNISQVGVLTGSYAVDTNDLFGNSVATSADGKTIIVGALNDEVGATTTTGIAYVFDRIGNSFNQVGILTGSFAIDVSDQFGRAVATSADGKTIIVTTVLDGVVGGPNTTGLAYVFDRIGNSFNQVGILTAYNANSYDYFGNSVATSADGTTIIIGAPGSLPASASYFNGGSVHIYDRVGNLFNQVGFLTGPLGNISDQFGFSVATSADGKTIVVGSVQAGTLAAGIGASTGIAYVYDRIGNSFNQVGILTGSYAVNISDEFGYSVATSADGKTIVVGATRDEVGITTSNGIVYVYDRVGNSFNQVGILTGTYAKDDGDLFGYAVDTSADGKTIIVSATNDEVGITTATGIVYVYKRIGNSFNQVGILTGSLAVNASDRIGWSVATSADGKNIIVGARQDELLTGVPSTGVVYVFDDINVYSSTFGFSTYTEYQAINLSEPSNITIDDGIFTVIRNTEDITQNFSYTDSPLDPVTIGIIDTQRLGSGNKIEFTNNGESIGPSQWKQILNETEPNIGAGNTNHYVGISSWPYDLLSGYAAEGYIYNFEEFLPPVYTSISPTGLSTNGATCNSYTTNITTAETNLQSIINKNLPEIYRLISASLPLRKYRDGSELKAWSYLQSASYLRGEMNNIQSDINSLESFDYNSL